MYKTKYLTGLISPSAFFKMDAGAVIYYEIDHTKPENCTAAQRFISNQASKAKTKIKQTKLLTVEPDTINAKLLLKVEFMSHK